MQCDECKKPCTDCIIRAVNEASDDILKAAADFVIKYKKSLEDYGDGYYLLSLLLDDDIMNAVGSKC